MSIDDRLRAGVAANTEHLVPNLELELASTLRKAHRRRQLRMGAVAAAAAGVAVASWLTGLTDIDRADRPFDPVETPRVDVDSPRDMSGLLGALVPGSYWMGVWGTADGAPHSRVQVEVPEGYYSNGGYVVDAGNNTFEPDQFGEVAVWRVEHIITDPCDANYYTDIGPSVRALARALTRQPRQETTSPTPVTLDGYEGLYLEVTSTIPDLGACGYNSHMLWHTGNSGDRAYGQDLPGVTNHLWILDVDGTRLVIAVSNYPDQTDAVHQGLIDIAETIRFVEP
ncbi:MAG TPA: hypothetical protein VLI04_17210 [Nocardioidaceae bacterium]|nr:hypothetical protein [Nocardioidaceae bacterium]